MNLEGRFFYCNGLQVDTLKERERFLGRMDLFLNEEFPGITITDQQMFERSGKVNYHSIAHSPVSH